MKFDVLMKKAASSHKNVDKLWKAVEFISDFIEKMKDDDPEKYWYVTKCINEILIGKHYTEELATKEVEKIIFIDRDGKQKKGGHWSMDEIVDLTEDIDFSSSVTDGDKFVACNIFYEELCNVLDDNKIIEAAVNFFFRNDNWSDHSKIWDYMKDRY